MRRTTIIAGLVAASLASLAIAPAAGAKSREPVTRADVFAAAHRLAAQAAAELESLSNGTVAIDRSQTSFGNYLPYGKFRKAAAFAIFGTRTAGGEANTLWCIGNVDVARAGNGRMQVARELTCLGS
jgi:hypothetical protein